MPQPPPIVPGPSEPYTLATVMPQPTKPSRPGWVVPVIVGLVVLLLVMGGVVVWALTRSGTSSDAPDAAVATSSSTAASSATIGQYAGMVNESGREIREIWSEYDTKCFLRPNQIAACPLRLLNLSILAETLVIKLDGAAKPGVPAFIGAPPKEIERLVADTREAAQGVVVAGKTVPIDEIPMSSAVRKLLGVLDRWAPYL